jgi:hypothetical protein
MCEKTFAVYSDQDAAVTMLLQVLLRVCALAASLIFVFLTLPWVHVPEVGSADPYDLVWDTCTARVRQEERAPVPGQKKKKLDTSTMIYIGGRVGCVPCLPGSPRRLYSHRHAGQGAGLGCDVARC